MPKRSKYPKLRVHVRKGKGGQVQLIKANGAP